MTLLQAVTALELSPEQLPSLLRSYTTRFVIDEQAILQLRASDEWAWLVQQITTVATIRPLRPMTSSRS